jgi:hypothetical protein
MNNEIIDISTSYPMINNSCRKNKKSKAKKDLPVDNKVPKQQNKPPTMKADVVNMPAGIIDINNTPDIATWNKKLHIEENTSGIIADGLNDAEKIQRPTTIGIGLRAKKALKKDLIVDPGNRKEVEEATKSGFTLTDEASDFSR